MFGIPLQGSILTMLFLDSLNPVPLIRTLDHLAGKSIKLDAEVLRPISYFREPPVVLVLPSTLRFRSPMVSEFLVFITGFLFSWRSNFRDTSGLDVVDVIIKGMSIGLKRRSSMSMVVCKGFCVN